MFSFQTPPTDYSAYCTERPPGIYRPKYKTVYGLRARPAHSDKEEAAYNGKTGIQPHEAKICFPAKKLPVIISHGRLAGGGILLPRCCLDALQDMQSRIDHFSLAAARRIVIFRITSQHFCPIGVSIIRTNGVQ